MAKTVKRIPTKVQFQFETTSSFYPTIRQATATVASSFFAFSSGITLGFSGVILTLLDDDPTFVYDDNTGSWIASIAALSAALGCLIAGFILDRLGRKPAHIYLAIPFFIGRLLIAFAANTSVMIVGRFINGVCTGAARTITVVYLGEISDPKNRGFTLFCPSIAISLGALFSHVVASFCSWRTASMIFAAPNVVIFVTMLFLKESPLWLMYKRKHDLGIEVFRWFRGMNEASEAELSAVLEKQFEHPPPAQDWKETLMGVLDEGFWKPFLTTTVMFTMVHFCGVNIMTFYALPILQNTFKGEADTTLLIIIMDIVRLCGSIFISLVGKYLPKKVTVITCGFGSSVALFALVIILKISLDDLIGLPLTATIVFMAMGEILCSVAWGYIGELFPANIRGLGSGISSSVSYIILFSALKITPGIMTIYGTLYLYVLWGVVTVVCCLLLCFLLPNTDGMSLQEIEDRYHYKKKISSMELTATPQL